MKKTLRMPLIESLRVRKLAYFLLFTSFVHNLHAYRVVIDPGHGGKRIGPQAFYGDKYDPVSEKYLDIFRPGAYFHGVYEHEEVYQIAEQVRDLLELTQTSKGRKAFHKILLKYDRHASFPAEPIEVILSRPPGYRDRYTPEVAQDLNSAYRLYDYPDQQTRELQPGTLSRINAFQPHLVVSLHLTGGTSGDYGALSSVITPGFDTFALALDYVHGDDLMRDMIEETFTKSPYAEWMESGSGRSLFEWFLCDAWIYFTGYWSKPDGLAVEPDLFRGSRQNMISWAYRDTLYPQVERGPYTPYAGDLIEFKPAGAFWEREMSIQERWRREGGYEGFGGDNYYASNELLRFVRKGLHVDRVRKANELPELRKPYFSTWSVPTYVNAISAYLELAYIDNEIDANRIIYHKNTHAEAIAAGIYSLFYGSQQKSRHKDFPNGAPINFSKYEEFGGENYFESAALPEGS